jgi:hypothetical protein
MNIILTVYYYVTILHIYKISRIMNWKYLCQRNCKMSTMIDLIHAFKILVYSYSILYCDVVSQ